MTGENREAMRDVSLFLFCIGGSAIMKEIIMRYVGIDKNSGCVRDKERHIGNLAKK